MKTIGEAQRNMVSFTVVFVCISFLFLLVGALLYGYMDQVAVGMAALETPHSLSIGGVGAALVRLRHRI